MDSTINFAGQQDILLEAFKIRNAKFHDDYILTIQQVASEICHHLEAIILASKSKNDSTAADLRILHQFGYSPQFSIKKIKLVRWMPPVNGYCLNVDGACKGNPGDCGGGGCIRDSGGSVLVAFAHFYGMGNSMVAESRAMCDGIRLADFLGIHLTVIYSDSLALVNSLNSGRCPAWQALRWWREANEVLHQPSHQVDVVERLALVVGGDEKVPQAGLLQLHPHPLLQLRHQRRRHGEQVGEAEQAEEGAGDAVLVRGGMMLMRLSIIILCSRTCVLDSCSLPPPVPAMIMLEMGGRVEIWRGGCRGGGGDLRLVKADDIFLICQQLWPLTYVCQPLTYEVFINDHDGC
ncbi:hypothetical protein Taro_048848 [Colocasia esculenta]|uniref:RNase H type-1 domain-containing protein n=1 Tax=Colocasia esculenta TaxID=4460 RepID=A0A843X998_COLES|nr:hypothetical protein [Colocasia esculenta]